MLVSGGSLKLINQEFVGGGMSEMEFFVCITSLFAGAIV